MLYYVIIAATYWTLYILPAYLISDMTQFRMSALKFKSLSLYLNFMTQS